MDLLEYCNVNDADTFNSFKNICIKKLHVILYAMSLWQCLVDICNVTDYWILWTIMCKGNGIVNRVMAGGLEETASVW